MRLDAILHSSAARTPRFGAPVVLIACSLLPAAALFFLQSMPSALMAGVPMLVQLLLISIPLLAFLLAALLWQSRALISALERKETAARNVELDGLSNLTNRASLERTFTEAAAAAKPGAAIALIAIDIDTFKSVNDKYGHLAGDRLIVGVADRLRQVAREGDCLARVGGDEFSIMLVGIRNAGQCASVAHRIQESMLAPFDVGHLNVFATLSLGISLYPQDGRAYATLAQASDLALYRAKHEGRNRFAFFDKTMEQTLHLGLTIEDDLRKAIGADELTVVYQPLMSACGARIQGLEALVRWSHPEFGVMSPEEFIPLAERRGLIVPLGEWVLRRACFDARRWPTLRMAVNVSPVQFRQRDFVETVKTIIAQSGIEPTRLDLELTEGVLIQDADQAEAVIMDLRALGIRMGLDDFGSGYSSMIYLRRFAFDKIKIDRAFLQSMEASGEGAIILDYIVSLGHALGLTVTAEGVEHEEQVAFLRKLGCDEMQGFYFSAPVTADTIDEQMSLQAWNQASDLGLPSRSTAAA